MNNSEQNNKKERKKKAKRKGKFSTIVVDTITRDRLKHIGHKGQTYDEIILELLKGVDTQNER